MIMKVVRMVPIRAVRRVGVAVGVAAQAEAQEAEGVPAAVAAPRVGEARREMGLQVKKRKSGKGKSTKMCHQ